MSIVLLSAYMAWLDQERDNQIHWIVPLSGMVFDLAVFLVWRLT